MKRVTILIATALIATTNFAQLDGAEKALKTATKGSSDSTKTWDKGGTFNVNATQVSLTNWAGGGQNSVSLQGVLGLFANYSKGKNAWDNSLDMSYGVIKTGFGAPWFKNDDRIELNSKFGRKASKNWYYAALLNFRTQFVEGYAGATEQAIGNYLSNMLAPSYTTFAIGMDYKPGKKFSMFLSPATLKVTTVLDDSLGKYDNYGVKANEGVRTEFGGYLKATFTEPKVFGNENLAFKTDLSLFTNYQENPQNIDINWNAALTAKVAKYFTVSLTTNLIYDHDIAIQTYDVVNGLRVPQTLKREDGSPYLDADGNALLKKGPKTQFKEVLAVGFAYKF